MFPSERDLTHTLQKVFYSYGGLKINQSDSGFGMTNAGVARYDGGWFCAPALLPIGDTIPDGSKPFPDIAFNRG